MSHKFYRILFGNREIRSNPHFSEAKKLISEGVPKQQVFEELGPKVGSKLKTMEILENIPSNEAKKKFGFLNGILVGMVIFVAGSWFIVATDRINIIAGFLIIAVIATITKRVNTYYWIVGIFAFLFLGVVGLIGDKDPLKHWIGLGVTFFTPFIIGLLIWLPKRLSPPPKESREYYIDKDGKRRVKTIFTFMD